MICTSQTGCVRVQMEMFEKKFETEKRSRAEADGKMEAAVRKEYETKMKEMKKDLRVTEVALENTEQLLVLNGDQFRAHMEQVGREQRDYQEKMESELAKQTLDFKEQVIFESICMQV